MGGIDRDLDRLQVIPSVTRQTGPLPFSDRYTGHIKYSELVIPAVNLSSLAVTYAFRLSSLYDPNLTGTGHQPYQYDSLTPIYTYYKVHRTDYRITLLSASAVGLFVGLNVYSTMTGSGSVVGKDVSSIMEREHTRLRVVPTTGDQQTVFTGSIDLALVHGLTKFEYDADGTNFNATGSSNPSNNVIMEVVLVDPQARAAVAVDAMVEFVYHFEMWGYNPPAQS